MNLVLHDCSSLLSRSKACKVLVVNRSTVHRRANPAQPKRVRQESKPQPRALSLIERAILWETLISSEFVDQHRD